jgi:hypothetical protein
MFTVLLLKYGIGETINSTFITGFMKNGLTDSKAKMRGHTCAQAQHSDLTNLHFPLLRKEIKPRMFQIKVSLMRTTFYIMYQLLCIMRCFGEI